MIAGSQGWEEIEEFGRDKLDWLRKVLVFIGFLPYYALLKTTYTPSKVATNSFAQNRLQAI